MASLTLFQTALYVVYIHTDTGFIFNIDLFWKLTYIGESYNNHSRVTYSINIYWTIYWWRYFFLEFFSRYETFVDFVTCG